MLADRGFDIADSVGVMQTALHIPAFTKGKSQLSAVEIEQTRTIANVCIHLERVIAEVSNITKYFANPFSYNQKRRRHTTD